MVEERMALPHKLTLNDRKTLSLEGVTQVVSFDEDTVALRIGPWTLRIHGSELKMNALSLERGQVALQGKIDAMIYEQQRPRLSFRQRSDP